MIRAHFLLAESAMQVTKDKVVMFHYTLTDAAGHQIDSSREGGEPLAILAGHGSLIPGVEKALEGKSAGDQFVITVPPEEGYGLRDEDRTQRVPKKYFPAQIPLHPGLTVNLQTQQGPRPVTVLKVGMSVVDVDLNHPMAGKSLHFDIEVVEVRAASPEELEHGHVHGDGGHHH